MAVHTVPLKAETLRGAFSRDFEPVLAIASGDTVVARCLDAGWGSQGRKMGEAVPEFVSREEGHGHALIGPIAVEGAKPGDVLQVDIVALRPGTWGFTSAGPRPWLPQFNFDVHDNTTIGWTLDPDAGVARDRDGLDLTVPLRPFMGVMGNAPAESGVHSTIPPRSVGGNIDCRELIAGSTLYLPIAVPGALFSVGDGHGAQGDGEISSTAIECPMDRVELRLTHRPDLHFTAPRAETTIGYLTFGIGTTLDEATAMACSSMLDHLQSIYGLTRARALALASVVVNLHVTQIVNEVVGVHAVLPTDAFSM